MTYDWSCSIREHELEQRVTIGQWPHGNSPRVSWDSEFHLSRVSSTGQVTVTGASQNPVIVRQVCRDKTGPRSS